PAPRGARDARRLPRRRARAHRGERALHPRRHDRQPSERATARLSVPPRRERRAALPPPSPGAARMKLVKVAAAVVNQTPLDWEGNRKRISAALAAARREAATVVCFPELSISGY